jgi:hypothetical protein
MDRYDAILEHLKKARSRGFDSVANRLDSIAEDLGKLIQTAKSSVQNARPASDDEVLPLADVEAMVAALREEANEQALSTRHVGISLDNLRVLDAARSQSELLRALLPMLTEHVGRAAVLVIREGIVSAWSGIGFADGEKLKKWHGGVAASPDFQHLVDTAKPLGFSPRKDPLVSGWLSGDATSEEAVLLPISLRGKLMGMVYVDHAGDQPWNVEAAQALNAVACWLIDTLHHRTTVPTPTLAEIATPEGRMGGFDDAEVFEPPPEQKAVVPPPDMEIRKPPVSDTFQAPSRPASVTAPPPPAPRSRLGHEEAIEFEPVSERDFTDQPVASDTGGGIDYDFEPEPVGPEPSTQGAGFDPSATVRIESYEPPARPAATPPPPAASAFSAGSGPSIIETEAPPPVRPFEPSPEIATEGRRKSGVAEDGQHEEARRFARLLVSEIKLYNEDEVERGRVEKNLADRLKEDIDRSREMYEKRIPAEIRTGHDYFRDELVRILADGDADALGM